MASLRDQDKLSRLTLPVLGIIGIVFAILLVFTLVNRSSITVSTSTVDNYVRITKIVDQKGDRSPLTTEALHRVSTSVKPGKYEISAFSKNTAVSQVVTIKAGQKLRFTLNPSKLGSVEPAYGSGALDFVVDGTQMFFIDPIDHSLNRIDADGNLGVISNTLSFSSARWASASLGVVQDDKYALYAVQNGALNEIKLPFKNSNADRVGYDLAKNGQLYISFGNNVYVGGIGGDFKKIYTSASSRLKVFAGAGHVAVIETSSGGNKKGEATIVVVGDSGNTIKAKHEVYDLSWSPDGKYLALSSDEGSTILNKSLAEVASISGSDITSFSWASNDTLYFGRSKGLWRYSVATGQSALVSELDGDASIAKLSVDPGGRYAYFSTAENPSLRLFRVGLQNQAVSAETLGLPAFLPDTIGPCTLNYIHIAKPAILVGYPVGEATGFASCLTVARDELGHFYLNPEQFAFAPQPFSQN